MSVTDWMPVIISIITTLPAVISLIVTNIKENKKFRKDVLNSINDMKTSRESDTKTLEEIQIKINDQNERDKEHSDKLTELKDDIKNLYEQLDNHSTKEEERYYMDLRSAINDRAERMMIQPNVSIEFLNQTLDMVDRYEEYCRTHQKFPNSVITESIEFIRNKHKEIKRAKGS